MNMAEIPKSKKAARQIFAARREIILIFSLFSDDHLNEMDISGEILELLDHLAARVLNAKTPNFTELFSRREKLFSRR